MEKKSKNNFTENDIKDLAWRNFYETGEIGAYMFYKKISEEKDGANNNKRNSPKGS